MPDMRYHTHSAVLMAVRVDRPRHAGRRGKVVVRRVEIFGWGRGDDLSPVTQLTQGQFPSLPLVPARLRLEHRPASCRLGSIDEEPPEEEPLC
jgi:hypothetical protein